MDGYRIVEVGGDFVVVAGDVSILKCQTERDAEVAVATALDLLENPNEWWRVLQERLSTSESAATTDEAIQAAA